MGGIKNKETIDSSTIESFLQGSDPQKYIVAIEAPYDENKVSLIINDPKEGKYIEKHKYKPFIWLKESVSKMLYNGNKADRRKAMVRHKITIKRLKTTDSNGYEPDRMSRGFKYIATCNGSPNDLTNFFKYGGVPIFGGKGKERLFMSFRPEEQFLMQTGKRLFKGMDDYDDIHRFQFDLETMGLDPYRHPIFQIGMKDNRGFERIIEIKGDTEQERRDSERDAIQEFFNVIDRIKPDTITGYNSENFDWDYFYKRCEVLYLNIEKMAKSLNTKVNIKRKSSTLKLGQETEYFEQTMLWGYNILDIIHAVRKAQSINSNIKKAGLKYITQFSKVAKKNRIYVDGDKLHSTWTSKGVFYLNDKNGDWFEYDEINPSDEHLEKISGVNTPYKRCEGDYIVQRYLLDDLWETEQVDAIYNQASFLVAKLLPTSFMRSSTMGTAGTWTLIMSAWSLENKLAIPDFEPKREFAGGLARLLEVGYALHVIKLDYAALYPKTQLTHGIFPDLDISGVMEGLLTYIVDTRDDFKFLTNDHKVLAKKLIDELEKNRASMSSEEISDIEIRITHNQRLASNFDKKQLPLKILANSFFGSFGAPYLFPWGDIDSAEEITCRGRQYLRLMVKHFTEKHGFRPLVGDSVTGRSPIYIKYKDSGLVDIIPIQDVFLKNTDGERDFTEKEFLVLTKNGWVEIEYVYRHKTDKPIHRVTTRDRFVECTSDHSLFSDGVEVKPTDLVRGDKLDVYNLKLPTNVDMDLDEAWLLGFFVADGSSVYGDRKQKYFSKRKSKYLYHMGKRSEWTLGNQDIDKLKKTKRILDNMFDIDAPIKDYLKSSGVYKLKTHYRKVAEWFSKNCYDNNRIKTIPISILNSNLKVKEAFINGFSAGDNLKELKNITQKSQNVMAGVNLIFKDLKVDFSLKLRKDKENIIAFNLGEKYKVNINKSPRNTDMVWTCGNIENPDNYVYDISADGTFICGVGGIVCHNTDGFNFAIPDGVEDIKYTCKASHWKTDKYECGQKLVGLEAVLAEFNETYMEGRMGLDIDDICESTINFRRKNYANLIDGKVKLVGNSIKSKAMPIYIEEFIDKGVRLLLDGKGKEFIEYYYEYVDDIYNCRIPLVKIATKKRVKMSKDEYQNVYIKTKTIAGTLKSRQAHMELAIKHNLNVDNGDTIYYVNIGKVKSTGDIKKITNKETGNSVVQLNCKLIPNEQIEKNPTLTTDEYNVPKYLESFNKRIHSLLVCFNPDIREEILIGVEKIKIKGVKSKDLEWTLQERGQFTTKQCSMHSGTPFNETDQDSYADLMTLEDKEIRFWSSVNKVPNLMDEDEWVEIESDWVERMRQARLDGITNEKLMLDDIFKRLEKGEIENLETTGDLPKQILNICTIVDHSKYGHSFHSIKWDIWLCELINIFNYKDLANTRDVYYNEHPELFKKLKRGQTKYDIWFDLMEKEREKNGLSSSERFNPNCTEKFCCSEEWDGMCPCYEQFEGDKDKLKSYLESQKEVINEVIGTCHTCVSEQNVCECKVNEQLPLPKIGDTKLNTDTDNDGDVWNF